MKTVLLDYPAQRTKPYLLDTGSFSHPVSVQPLILPAVEVSHG